ncbi:MAG TPA: hypothetical protein VES66_04305 [Terriglobales bacterium]|nr:hypothetical protein [Terriglobales bacterium]
MKSTLLSAILLVSCAVGAQAPATAPVALKDEPHHHLLFENDYVRAWAFGIAGHQATLLHNHDLPYLGVAVGSAAFINAVTGKPEAHATVTDGQVGYSKGGFSHVVRTETDAPVRNLTIELLRPQGAAHNRCVKVVADSPLDCPQTTASPLGAATTLVLETDEVAVQSGEVSSILRIAGADTQPARLLAVLDQSELSVEIPGQPAKKLLSGEALWLSPGAAATFANSSARATSRFVLVTFKDSGAK